MVLINSFFEIIDTVSGFCWSILGDFSIINGDECHKVRMIF